MKRHDVLIPLSHDHQLALAQGLRLKRSSAGSHDERYRRAKEFVHFAQTDLIPHFAEEEQLMTAVVAVKPNPEFINGQRRLLEEHQRMWAEVDALSDAIKENNVTAQQVETLGQFVSDHVRFEERDLFHVLQVGLTDAELEQVGEHIKPRNRG